jgi:hypothetical protein
MPKVNAAENPITVHNNGITMMYQGILFSDSRKMASVNMVVGQGKPNVGE